MRVDFGVVVVIVSRGVEVGKGLFSEDHTIKFTCDKYYLSHSLPPCLFCPSQYTQGSTLDKAMQAMFHCHNHIRKLASVFFFFFFSFSFLPALCSRCRLSNLIRNLPLISGMLGLGLGLGSVRFRV